MEIDSIHHKMTVESKFIIFEYFEMVKIPPSTGNALIGLEGSDGLVVVSSPVTCATSSIDSIIWRWMMFGFCFGPSRPLQTDCDIIKAVGKKRDMKSKKQKTICKKMSSTHRIDHPLVVDQRAATQSWITDDWILLPQSDFEKGKKIIVQPAGH